MPKRETGVYLRTGSNVFQWRIRAPADLAHLYPGLWAQRRSLGTTDAATANAKAASLRAHWLARFERERRSTTTAATSGERIERFTPELVQSLAAQLYRDILATDEELRAGGMLELLRSAGGEQTAVVAGRTCLDGAPPFAYHAFAKINQETLELLRGQWQRRELKPTYRWLKQLGDEVGLFFDEQTPGVVDAITECLKASVRAAEVKIARDRGEVIETPVVERDTARTAQAMTLRDVLPKWTAAKRRRQGTVKACELALQLFEDRFGDVPVHQITRAQGVDFQAWLQTLGGSSKTAHERITWVKALLGFAHLELELIERQPWKRLDIAYRTESHRTPWTREQLATLFGLPLFTSYELPTLVRGGEDAAYWIPLLGLYTGARVSELAQLLVSDVQAISEIHALSISDAAEGQRLKSEAARRLVPLHSELIRLGFLDYVRDVRNTGAKRLFPKLRLRHDKPGGYFSEWFGQFKPEGLPDFHSFRHTLRSALADAEVPESIMDRITGHSLRGSTGTRVYEHTRPQHLQRAIERVTYPLSLPRVYPEGSPDAQGAESTAPLLVTSSSA